MRIIVLLIILCMSLILLAEARAEAVANPRTVIEFMPQPCPDNTLCNTYHIRSVLPSGVVEFEHAFPSNTMTSRTMIIVHTEKRDIFIWSEK